MTDELRSPAPKQLPTAETIMAWRRVWAMSVAGERDDPNAELPACLQINELQMSQMMVDLCDMALASLRSDRKPTYPCPQGGACDNEELCEIKGYCTREKAAPCVVMPWEPSDAMREAGELADSVWSKEANSVPHWQLVQRSLFAVLSAAPAAQAAPSARAPTKAQVEALHRIKPSELPPDELWRRNGEYVSLYEVLDLFTPTEEAPQGWRHVSDVIERGVAWLDRDAKYVAVVKKGKEYILTLPELPLDGPEGKHK